MIENYKEISIKAYQCTNCKKISTNQTAADTCCKVFKCRRCNENAERFHELCIKCEEKVRFENGNKIDLVDYQEEWLHWEDRFFEGIEELEEYCQSENIEIPKYVYACEIVKFGMDILSSVEAACDEYDEDMFDRLDTKSLDEMFTEWVNKQNQSSVISTNQIVLL
ncbi:hypothetical protein CKN82_11260 [Carnobacterium divergens]|uniref:hypothetical protein n=1 Tax=Carnobacterium divergens TaxID=2748 RepID=UPI001072E248|nr:hypothetical protein [Carnobacterium divergens]TFI66664.1 hypothetical protein CKN70_11415 [Carnobacterium divergens]TFI78958.1 hypothetical protein CKN68_11375 [Carnobacterium divergens]TFI86098.1 hypothetical protein CKN72_11140 [Carnobacterium divergens]TFI95317.1 hypothetical protein CKN67_11380 [Carnobacterium divergens]TFI96379.1 hypothetical protein CKN82_11260 [Carnobacterium divergens]